MDLVEINTSKTKNIKEIIRSNIQVINKKEINKERSFSYKLPTNKETITKHTKSALAAHTHMDA
jgi:hypothetical protein